MIRDIILQLQNNTNSHDGYNRLLNFREGEPYRCMAKELFPELRASLMILSYNKIWNPIKIEPIAHRDNITTLIPKIHNIELRPITITHKPEPRPFYMSLKTNMLGDILLIPNLGVEFYLGGRYSIAANWMYAWWKSDREKWYWRNYGGDIVLHKWFGRKAKEKPLSGHHIGPYAQIITYDFLVNGKGYMAGKPGGDIFDRANYAVGIEYGYSLRIARRLNVDFSLGVGYMWGKYYEYAPIDIT